MRSTTLRRGRNPFYTWDFYDAPDAGNNRDEPIDLLNDIFGIAFQFGYDCN